MKLIFCPRCKDILLLMTEMRGCGCGASWGRYTGEVNAEVGGKAIVVGIANESFREAVEKRPLTGNKGKKFDAFVAPKVCDSVAEIKEPPKKCWRWARY